MKFGKYNSSKDMLDDYMGYKLSTEGETQTTPMHSSFSFKGIIIAIIIIIGVVMIYDAARPKCAHSDCNNTPENGSGYCMIHDPKYYKPQNSYTHTFTTAAATTLPATTTAYKSTTRKTTKKTTTREADEYDAQDYVDPEDFYDDHYDDFWDYEDAEDYWNEYN